MLIETGDLWSSKDISGHDRAPWLDRISSVDIKLIAARRLSQKPCQWLSPLSTFDYGFLSVRRGYDVENGIHPVILTPLRIEMIQRCMGLNFFRYQLQQQVLASKVQICRREVNSPDRGDSSQMRDFELAEKKRQPSLKS